MTKTYKYKELEFTLKPFNLDMMNRQGRLLKEYERLSAKENIDLRRDFEKEFKMKDELEKSISRFEQALETLPPGNEAERERLQGLLDAKREEYETDGTIQILKKLLKDTEGSNLILLITNREIIKPFIDEVLIGDVNSIDWEDENVAKFIGEVVLDFFTYSQTSKQK